MKVCFLWHLICVNNLDFHSEHLILFTSAVSFLRSSFSNFMVWVILGLLDPLSLHHLLFSFVFSNSSQLYMLASAHTICSVSVSLVNKKCLIDPQGKICSQVKKFEVVPSSLSPTLQSSSCLSCQCHLLSFRLSLPHCSPPVPPSSSLLSFCPAAQ